MGDSISPPKTRRRIFINGMNALQGGGQTYLLNLLQELPPNADIFVLLPDALKEKFPAQAGLEVITVGRWNANPLRRVIWENLYLPKMLKRLKIDIYFSAGGLFPLAPLPCKKVSAFRNMLPFSIVDRQRFPWGYKRFRYAALKVLLSRAFQRADVVIFISHYAKKVIDQVLPQRAGSSVVIYHGVGEQYRCAPGQPPVSASKLDYEYVLYVSILNVYKCHLEVVQAWADLRKRRLTKEKLVLVGPEYAPYAKQVRALIDSLGLKDEVQLIGNVPYAELPSYYHHAKVNLFASTCENCPNILLEALASGRPVICSNVEPMPEIAQGSARLFSPFDPAEITEALIEVLDHPERAEAMGKAASQRAAEFSWAKTRAETWKTLTTLVEG